VTPIFWGAFLAKVDLSVWQVYKNCVSESILGAKVLNSNITLAELLNGETVNQINQSNKSSVGFWGEGKTGVPGENLAE